MLAILIVVTGLMAGIYFAFSVFIMMALGALPDNQGAYAMNKINEVILKTLFLPIFFASSLAYAGLAIVQCFHWQGQSSAFILAAATSYIGGMFCVTALGNVPWNNKLKHSASDEHALALVWQAYRKPWTRLNHIRTLSCLASCVLLLLA